VAKSGAEAWRLLTELFFDVGVQTRMRAVFASSGLAPGVLKSLIHLDREVGLPMGDLAQRFGCDASYITTIADELERHGLAERRPHPTDRRVKTLVLTDEGERRKEQLLTALHEPPECLDALTATEQRTLRDLVRKMSAARTEVATPPRAVSVTASNAAAPVGRSERGSPSRRRGR
jgi:DNA-binding MarR family transcriptional regulator